MEFLKEVKNKIKEGKEIAKNLNERRIVSVFCSKNSEELIFLIKNGVGRGENLLLVHDKDEIGKELESLIKNSIKSLRVITYEKTTKILGTTFNNLVVDLRHNLNPDDIGRLIGIVKGGGLIFLIFPDFDKLENWRTRFQQDLATYPYKIEQVESNFEKRFLKKLLLSDCCLAIDLKEKRVIKEMKTSTKKPIIRRKKIRIPTSSCIPRRLYKICLTQEQAEVIFNLEKFWREGEKSAFVLKANRGRGKSASIGIFISYLVWEFNKIGKQLRIGVTAPEKENTEIVFKFLKVGLRKFKIRFREIENSIEVARGRIVIEYRRPVRLAENYYDLVIVDEAAGIPIPFLYKIIKKYRKTIFSTTIHGYEGAGRGFSIRFLKGIKEGNIAKVFEFKMEEPIRYSSNDAVEKWLFDTLLLDAEPCKLERKDLECVALGKLSYERINRSKWFHQSDEEVKHFFGIYILAHYRNRPKDVALLVDSPTHFPRCVKTETGKIVNSIHLAREGNLDEEIIKSVFEREKPKGHVVPLVLCRHYRNVEFGFLKGWRIVRIATHPEVMRKGIGSFALKKIEEEAREEGLDWIGVGFGATPLLLKFWIRNGFIPLHISLERNTVSGEYSVILVKPLSKRAKEIIKTFSYEFRLRILGSLMDVHFDIEPDIPIFLLKPFFKHKPHFNLNFTENQIKRMEAFLEEKLPYETVAEVCRDLAKYYFLNTENRPELTETVEKILILKCFLVKSWKRISNLMGMETKVIIKRFRETMKKLWKWYGFQKHETTMF